MKRLFLLATAATLAVMIPLMAVPEAQACALRWRRCALVAPCVAYAEPVVTQVVTPVVVTLPTPVIIQAPTPPTQVIMQAPAPLVDVQVRNGLKVHVQTPTTNVHVGLPPLTLGRFTVYYRVNGGWQPHGSYALRVRAQNAANALTANKGLETMVR